MKRRQFVVLDRDGTIIVERHYLSDPAQVVLLPGAASGLRRLRKMGLGLVVITNQSGIGRGYFDEERLDSIHQRMIELLEAEGAYLDGIYFCPHLPEDNCSCRKPRSGLLYSAAEEKGFDPRYCFVIGDNVCDIELGKRVGAMTFLVRTGHGAWVIAETKVIPNYIVDDLSETARILQRIIPSDSSL